MFFFVKNITGESHNRKWRGMWSGWNPGHLCILRCLLDHGRHKTLRLMQGSSPSMPAHRSTILRTWYHVLNAWPWPYIYVHSRDLYSMQTFLLYIRTRRIMQTLIMYSKMTNTFAQCNLVWNKLILYDRIMIWIDMIWYAMTYQIWYYSASNSSH